MMRLLFFLFAGALLLACAPGANAAAPLLSATLRVTVDGVTPAAGALRVELHDEATFSEGSGLPLRKTDLPQVAGDVSVTFERLPPGDYALRAFQDANGNGVCDMGEPQAISNGAARSDFEKAAIELKPGVTAATLHLK